MIYWKIFLNHFVSTIRRETLWTFSNILVGSYTQIEYVLSRPKLLSKIINLLNNDVLMVKREAVWCIANASNDSLPSQRKILIEAGAVEALLQMLKNKIFISEETNIIMILEAIESFLSLYKLSEPNPVAKLIKECNGLDYIKNIQCDKNISNDLHKKLQLLLENYLSPNDDNKLNSKIDEATN